jgi:hypothetical protein
MGVAVAAPGVAGGPSIRAWRTSSYEHICVPGYVRESVRPGRVQALMDFGFTPGKRVCGQERWSRWSGPTLI